jgi:inositol phosphorylceramide synthase catalytic subunit
VTSNHGDDFQVGALPRRSSTGPLDLSPFSFFSSRPERATHELRETASTTAPALAVSSHVRSMTDQLDLPVPARVQRAPAAKTWVKRLRSSSVFVFICYLSPFLATGLGYEVLRVLLRYRGEVHVGDLYAYEAALFPVHTSEGPRALSEVIARNVHPLLDVWCGATYFLFLIEVFGVSAYLFFRARPKMLQVSLGFLMLNLLGWVIWFMYPAAPPWYVDQYGTGPAILDVVSSPAGLSRFDAVLHAPIAATFYSKSANVFGAMPSLHAAYATLVAWVVMPLGGWLRVLTCGFALSIAFSAIYLRHHYILDVIAGVFLAVPVAMLVQAGLTRVDSARREVT